MTNLKLLAQDAVFADSASMNDLPVSDLPVIWPTYKIC